MYLLHYTAFILHFLPATLLSVAFYPLLPFFCILHLLHFQIITFRTHFTVFTTVALWTRTLYKNAFEGYYIRMHSCTLYIRYIRSVSHTRTFGCIRSCVAFCRPVAFAHCCITVAYVCIRAHYACITRCKPNAPRECAWMPHECIMNVRNAY